MSAPRRRRRAVGPAGSRPHGDEPSARDLGLEGGDDEPSEADRRRDEERLRADQPPHHDRGV